MQVHVSNELLKDVLDLLSTSNGLRSCEIMRYSEIGNTSCSAVIKQLKELDCIIEGAVRYYRKDGEVTLKTGYFYEQDLPISCKIRNSRHRKKNL